MRTMLLCVETPTQRHIFGTQLCQNSDIQFIVLIPACSITIVSEGFKGKVGITPWDWRPTFFSTQERGTANKVSQPTQSLMQRHRFVYDLLNDELKNGIHALSLKTKTKEEMDKEQGLKA